MGGDATEIWVLNGKSIASPVSLSHWLLEGHAPVSQCVANARAAVCAKCSLNEHEGLYEDIVGMAARVVKAALNRKHQMRLATIMDEDLRMCGACGCDLKLLVWAPSQVIDTENQQLPAHCWKPRP
jgi:hypothetical protein